MYEFLFKLVGLLEGGVEIAGNILGIAGGRKCDDGCRFRVEAGDQIFAGKNNQVIGSPMLDLFDCGDVFVQTNRSFR